MREITVRLYQFDELSEEAKEKALEEMRSISVNHEWWEFTYEDAKAIGLKITGFDLDRNRHAKGELLESATKVADLIIKNHGKDCNTHKLAIQFWADWDALVEKHSDGVNTTVVAEENEYDFDGEADELEKEFESNLLERYSWMLQQEYEYLTSDEAVAETIRANEYEFTEEGKRA